MERCIEPAIKSEKEDQFWMDSECKGEGTQGSVNLTENTIYMKDFLQIKDESKQKSDCIKKEMKDEVEVGAEEWEEFETEERDCFPGCVEGHLTDASQVSLTHTELTEVFQKVKVESQVDAEFNDPTLETVLGSTEWKTVKPEEDWSQVGLSHKSSTGLKSEGILRKKFGCEREAVVRLARLSLDTAVPLQGITSRRKVKHMTKKTVMLESMGKSVPQGPNMPEDPKNHLNNEDGSTELKESFSGRNIFGQLSAKAFNKSYVDQHSPANTRETQFSHNHSSYAGSNEVDLNICITQDKERKFKCPQCSFNTNYRSHFTLHCLNHSNIKKFACDQCSYKSNNKSYFNKHCLNHTNIKHFACDQCSYTTNDKRYLARHCVTHINIKEFACDQCSYKTNNKSHFNQHCVNHSNVKKYSCDQCSYRTNYRSTFTQHCLIHSSIKNIVCDQCSYKTNNKYLLKRHCADHSNIKKFACGQCLYKTNSRNSFTRHYLTHSNIKKYVCDQCSYRTNYRSTFMQHCLNHSNIKRFACDQCSYKTNDERYFTQHCLNHTNVKQFACDRCSYKASNKKYLARHCVTHSNVTEFACDQCSYKTKHKSRFTRHCLIHEDKKICNNLI